MILGIGCDLVSHALTEKLEWESDTDTNQRIFSKKEMDLYRKNKTIRFLAGRFAAKEALVKCLGTGMQDGLALTDIEILRSPSGAPDLRITGGVKDFADKMGIVKWHISISHSDTHSMAYVIAESSH